MPSADLDDDDDDPHDTSLFHRLSNDKGRVRELRANEREPHWRFGCKGRSEVRKIFGYKQQQSNQGTIFLKIAVEFSGTFLCLSLLSNQKTSVS